MPGVDLLLIEEALAVLGRLRESTVWSELTESDAVYTEVPLAMAGEGRDDAVVRGVIDLVYRVAEGGWKIVDYKTEAVDTSRHGAQVESYARCWERISGDRVVAKGLWSTQQGYVPI